MMKRWMAVFSLTFIVCLLTACGGGPGVRAYHFGQDAYACGDYHTAFVNYLYAANQDVVPAQYAVGYQYFYGIGVKRDIPTSIRWFQRAAWHSPRAQYALYLIQQKRPPQPWVFQLKRP